MAMNLCLSASELALHSVINNNLPNDQELLEEEYVDDVDEEEADESMLTDDENSDMKDDLFAEEIDGRSHMMRKKTIGYLHLIMTIKYN